MGQVSLPVTAAVSSYRTTHAHAVSCLAMFFFLVQPRVHRCQRRVRVIRSPALYATLWTAWRHVQTCFLGSRQPTGFHKVLSALILQDGVAFPAHKASFSLHA